MDTDHSSFIFPLFKEIAKKKGSKLFLQIPVHQASTTAIRESPTNNRFSGKILQHLTTQSNKTTESPRHQGFDTKQDSFVQSYTKHLRCLLMQELRCVKESPAAMSKGKSKNQNKVALRGDLLAEWRGNASKKKIAYYATTEGYKHAYTQGHVAGGKGDQKSKRRKRRTRGEQELQVNRLPILNRLQAKPLQINCLFLLHSKSPQRYKDGARSRLQPRSGKVERNDSILPWETDNFET